MLRIFHWCEGCPFGVRGVPLHPIHENQAAGAGLNTASVNRQASQPFHYMYTLHSQQGQPGSRDQRLLCSSQTFVLRSMYRIGVFCFVI